MHENSQILEDTLNDFGIEAKVTAVEQGPVITRYELMPAPGVKVSLIVSLGDDLALVLRATSVRFLADESRDFALVRALRQVGHDVTAVKEIMPGAEDEKVITR